MISETDLIERIRTLQRYQNLMLAVNKVELIRRLRTLQRDAGDVMHGKINALIEDIAGKAS